MPRQPKRSQVIPMRRPPRRRGRLPRISPILVMAPLAAFTAVLLWDGPPFATGLPRARPDDTETAAFARCAGPVRTTCVIDGDTFWYRGAKIRLADINAPETSEPACAAEARLGERATARLTALLNQGPFSLEPVEREQDRYGRRLYTVTRGGESLGGALVSEGLAERWKGYRGSWC
jgi:micrococcal nuclease